MKTLPELSGKVTVGTGLVGKKKRKCEISDGMPETVSTVMKTKNLIKVIMELCIF